MFWASGLCPTEAEWRQESMAQRRCPGRRLVASVTPRPACVVNHAGDESIKAAARLYDIRAAPPRSLYIWTEPNSSHTV
ncbi:hypothetical protein CEXT_60011 [Caerostris extrusa]|uniref:Sulfatase-modifying factor enzyme domain-containing protein n=1 Tax=Caerostris extrusa TaxID=172846 RepID=A0AAV4XYX0_CAEEX|nr:hypothetical protein CEXT_60011 [Caerostris extrusa]